MEKKNLQARKDRKAFKKTISCSSLEFKSMMYSQKHLDLLLLVHQMGRHHLRLRRQILIHPSHPRQVKKKIKKKKTNLTSRLLKKEKAKKMTSRLILLWTELEDVKFSQESTMTLYTTKYPKLIIQQSRQKHKKKKIRLSKRN